MRKGRLRHEAGHFMGTRFPAGTEVLFRPYDRDPKYLEVQMPDGYYLTMFPSDIEAIDHDDE